MSVLLLDLGNTRLKLACGDPAHAATVATAQALAHGGDGFDAALTEALDALPPVPTALFASVGAPALAAHIAALLDARGIAVERVAVDPRRPGLTLCYAQPERFGVDRWLALLGARASAGAECALLVVSCGTALTIDLVGADDKHVGGVIAPSPATMSEALRSRAAHLPLAPVEAPPGFACDTAGAIAAGCTGAALGLLQRCIADARTRTEAPLRVLLTGGGAAALCAALHAGEGHDDSVSYHPWLVLDGLAQLARERASTR